MLRALLSTAIVLGTAGMARAEPPAVTVIVRDGKVTPAQVAALEDGVRTWAEPGAIVLITIEEGVAIIEVDGRRRQIELGDWSDAETARRIVVHVVDLESEVELSALAAAPVPAVVAPGWAPTLAVMVEPTVRLPATAAPRGGGVLSLRGGHGVLASDPWTLGIAGELGLGAGRWRAAVGLGWTHGVAHRPGTPEEGRYDAWPVSAIGGVTIGPVELIGRATVAPAHVGGVVNASPVRLGGGAAVRWRRRIAGGSVLAVDLGVEAWTRRLAVTIVGDAVFTTPRLEPYLAIGVAWGRR